MRRGACPLLYCGAVPGRYFRGFSCCAVALLRCCAVVLSASAAIGFPFPVGEVVPGGQGVGMVLRDAGHEHLASPIASTVMGVPFRAPATGS
jgi:hypothetical protein